MEEIKFHAWYPRYKLMTEEPGTQSNSFTFTFISEADAPIGPLRTMENLVLLQYIGRKDKNGKEIYKGHILKEIHSDGKIYYSKIGWDNLRSCWCRVLPVWDEDSHRTYTSAGLGEIESHEIVGNEFQNPELLQ